MKSELYLEPSGHSGDWKSRGELNGIYLQYPSQPGFAYSNLTLETLEQGLECLKLTI